MYKYMYLIHLIGPNLAINLQHNKWCCVNATHVVKITGQYHPLNVDGELRAAPTLHSIGIPTGNVMLDYSATTICWHCKPSRCLTLLRVKCPVRPRRKESTRFKNTKKNTSTMDSVTIRLRKVMRNPLLGRRQAVVECIHQTKLTYQRKTLQPK